MSEQILHFPYIGTGLKEQGGLGCSGHAAFN
jgi:hypothetical protein